VGSWPDRALRCSLAVDFGNNFFLHGIGINYMLKNTHGAFSNQQDAIGIRAIAAKLSPLYHFLHELGFEVLEVGSFHEVLLWFQS
jgi:hypothetical protein